MDAQIELGKTLAEASRSRRRSLRRQRVVTAREQRRSVKAYHRWEAEQKRRAPMPKGRMS